VDVRALDSSELTLQYSPLNDGDTSAALLLCQIAPDQVLPIIDEVEGPQLFEPRGGSFSAIKPAQELAQVVVVAAPPGGREIVALQFSENRRASGRLSSGPARCIVRNAVPRLRPPLYCVKYGGLDRFITCKAYCTAMFSCNKYPQKPDFAACVRKITPTRLFQGPYSNFSQGCCRYPYTMNSADGWHRG
jgi:hypothetical protein